MENRQNGQHIADDIFKYKDGRFNFLVLCYQRKYHYAFLVPICMEIFTIRAGPSYTPRACMNIILQREV